ncbi:unnamed protein product [Litomosoides sigmodontis]|uniref:RING-type domain-containing protein n=1 Tax=Litomosoides sigmodontis TaxID=42156 RepID=A0A3P6TA62_LITSI|nr:unnamed protein product [Litomosoides sigmodontis]
MYLQIKYMEKSDDASAIEQRPFMLKKWNALATWTWDVECDICAICRVQLMDACLRCQSENKQDDCVVVWGECNHSFHNCCMALWVKQNNRCPLCQQAGLASAKDGSMNSLCSFAIL